MANLFLRQPRVHIDNIHNVPLDNANIGKMSSPQRFQILAFSISLLLLLRQAFVATKCVSDSLGMRDGTHALLLLDWLELNSFIRVLSPTRGTSSVEVFLDVMPTETTDLSGDNELVVLQGWAK